MPTFVRDAIHFSYREQGTGRPFVFQHGLGGDINQVFDLYTPPPGVRLITLDCRAHGATEPVGDEAQLRLATLADDVIALLDFLAVEEAIVGGISMGAGIALNLALRHPRRVRALVLLRPAWLDRPLPPHLLAYPAIAWLLRTYGAEMGRAHFAASGTYLQVLAESPDGAAALLGQFDQVQASERIARLERIPPDRPCDDLAACGEFHAPVLVLANRQDPVHPFDLAVQLAAAFPAAQFAEVTAKSVDRATYRRDVQHAIDTFLAQLIPT